MPIVYMVYVSQYFQHEIYNICAHAVVINCTIIIIATIIITIIIVITNVALSVCYRGELCGAGEGSEGLP